MKKLLAALFIAGLFIFTSSTMVFAGTLTDLDRFLQQEEIAPDKDAPTSTSDAGSESISTFDGSLTYTATDLTLPGINGLDLNITRKLDKTTTGTPRRSPNAKAHIRTTRSSEVKGQKYVFRYFKNGDTNMPVFIAFDTEEQMLLKENGTNQIKVASSYTANPYTVSGSYSRNDVSNNNLGFTTSSTFYLGSELPKGVDVNTDVTLVRDINSRSIYIFQGRDTMRMYDYVEDYGEEYRYNYLNGGWKLDLPEIYYDVITRKKKSGTSYDTITCMGYFYDPYTGKRLNLQVSGNIYSDSNYGETGFFNVTASLFSYKEDTSSTPSKNYSKMYEVKIVNENSFGDSIIRIIRYDGRSFTFKGDHLIAMGDRFNNQITLTKPSSAANFNYVRTITDTYGREIVVGPAGITVNGEQIVQYNITKVNNTIVDSANDYLKADNKYLFEVQKKIDYNTYKTITYQSREVEESGCIHAKSSSNPIEQVIPINTGSLIDQITLSTGAQINYEYVIYNYYNKYQRRLKSREERLSATGDAINKKTFQYSYNNIVNGEVTYAKTITRFAGLDNVTLTEHFEKEGYLTESVQESAEFGNQYHITTKNTYSERKGDGNKLLTDVATETRNTSDGSAIVTTWKYEYDNYQQPTLVKRGGVDIEKWTYDSERPHTNLVHIKKASDGTNGWIGTRNVLNSEATDKKSIKYTYAITSTGGSTTSYSSKERIEYEYNEEGEMIAKTEKGVTTCYGHLRLTASLARIWSLDEPMETVYITIFSVGNITTAADGSGTSTQPLQKTLIYDTLGRIKEEKDAKGYITSYGYDRIGRPTKVTYPDSSQETIAYDDINNVITATTPDGVKDTYNFDALGRPTKYSSSNLITYESKDNWTKSYDTFNRLASVSLLAAQNTGREIIEYDYYADGQQKQKRERLSSDNSLISQRDYEYAPYNNKTTTKVYTVLPGTSNSGEWTTVNQYTNKYGFKTRDQITYKENGANKTVFQDYVTDDLGRVTKIKDFKANAQNYNDYTTEYDYDYANRLVKTTTPYGYTQTNINNTTGLVTSERDANGNLTTYSYNGAGQVIQISTPLENSLTSGSDLTSVTKKYYDVNGNLTREEIKNSKTDVFSEYSADVTRYTYDEMDRLSTVITRPNNVDEVTKYEYDSRGNVTRMAQGLTSYDQTINPAVHNVTTYEYDSFGRLASTTDPEGFTELYDYNNQGEITSKIDRNGVMTTYQYESILNSPTSISVGVNSGSPMLINNPATMVTNQLKTDNELVLEGELDYQAVILDLRKEDILDPLLTDCDITSVTTPSDADFDEDARTIQYIVPADVESQEIAVEVSAGASWKLYSDAICTNEITDKIMSLTDSNNVAYIKVTAENGVMYNFYEVTIMRQAEEHNDDTEIVWADVDSQDVEIYVTDGYYPITGAAVTLNGEMLTSDENGKALFEEVPALNEFYTITADTPDFGIREAEMCVADKIVEGTEAKITFTISYWEPNAQVPDELISFPMQASQSSAIDAMGLSSPIAQQNSLGTLGEWVTGPSMAYQRDYHTAIEYDGNIYVIGTSTDTKTMEIYNIQTNMWSYGADLPMTSTKIYEHTATLYNGKIYVMGGRGSDNSNYTCNMIYDIATNTWSLGTSSPVASAGHQAVEYEGKIYIVNGYGTGATEDDWKKVRIYNIATNSWTIGSSMTNYRSAYGTVTLYNGKIYVIGGSKLSAIKSTEIYDIGTNTWTTGANMAMSRRYHTATPYNGKIYVCGGVNAGNNKIIEIYDISTNIWKNGPSLSQARSNHTALEYNGKIYVFGGIGSTALSSLEILDTDTAAFTKGANMNTARYDQVPLLYNGKIYTVGGLNSSGYLNTMDIYTIEAESELPVCGCTSCGFNEAAFTVGNGTSTAPYEIWNAQQLNHVRSHLDLSIYFKLMNDIDLTNFDCGTGYGWEPIGPSGFMTGFQGVFDGNNKTIIGLSSTKSTDSVGLFGYVNAGGIRNVRLANVNINTTTFNVGGIVGRASGITISNCIVLSGSITGGSSVGGIAGSSYQIINCYNASTVTGNTGVGGIIGYNSGSATTTNCFNTGAINGNTYVGGIVGQSNGMKSTITVTNCYNTGSVQGSSGVGGVVGYSSSTAATNCYNAGTVSVSVSGAGGIIGNVGSYYNAINCYYDDNKCIYGGINNVDETGKAEGRTTDEMVDPAFATTMGSAFVASEPTTEGNCTKFYYPELAVFQNSTDSTVREASKASVFAYIEMPLPGPELITFTYDPLGNITQMVDNLGTTYYSYNGIGNLMSETRDDIIKTHAYDANGNRTYMSISQNNAPIISPQTYTYDWANRLTKVSVGGDTTSYTYNAGGNLLTETTTNGTQTTRYTTYGYNSAGLPKARNSYANGINVGSETQSYLANGNITTRDTATFLYDGVGRLTEERPTSTSSTGDKYTYDTFGNRFTKTTKTGANKPTFTDSHTYDKNNRLISKINSSGPSTEYTYDNNGNMTGKVTGEYSSQYAYDTLNRLTTVFDSFEATSYKYNGNGLMASKTTSDGETKLIYDDVNIVAEIHPNGDITTYQRGLKLISQNDGTTKLYYHQNLHGDVVKLTTATGIVTAEYTYDAFGNQLTASGSAAQTNPFRYCGEYLELSSGLIYLRARWYDPSLGRFTSEDSAKDGMNWYIYAGNNPLRYNDPTGHWKTGLHKDMTSWWFDYYGGDPYQANIIMAANASIDEGDYSALNMNDEAQSWHFNRNPTGDDSRLVHANEMLDLAIKTWNNGDYLYFNGNITFEERHEMRELALTYLGMGLHSIQDMDAHWDYGTDNFSKPIGVPHHTEDEWSPTQWIDSKFDNPMYNLYKIDGDYIAVSSGSRYGSVRCKSSISRTDQYLTAFYSCINTAQDRR